jgi:hypothetical protein
MIDVKAVLLALGVSAAVALVAAAVMRRLVGGGWRSSDPMGAGLGGALGIGLGFLAGNLLLADSPLHWPPKDDSDRLFFVLLPAVVLVEIVSALRKVPAWVAWPLRILVAAGAARVLLHGSRFLADVSGTGSSEWSLEQQWQILGGLASLLAGVWSLLALLQRRTVGPSTLLALCLVSAGTALTIMLSGSLSGGQQVLPLAGALAGAVVAGWLFGQPAGAQGALGVGLVMLFGLLLSGRFFGSATSLNSMLLFLAPLLSWLPELPRVARLRPSLRSLLRVGLVALPILVVVFLAKMKFDENSKTATTRGNEPTIEDYMNFKP